MCAEARGAAVHAHTARCGVCGCSFLHSGHPLLLNQSTAAGFDCRNAVRCTQQQGTTYSLGGSGKPRSAATGSGGGNFEFAVCVWSGSGSALTSTLAGWLADWLQELLAGGGGQGGVHQDSERRIDCPSAFRVTECRLARPDLTRPVQLAGRRK